MGLKWSAIFCPQAKFVLKTDDDIFVNVGLLHTAALASGSDMANKITGCIKNGEGGFRPVNADVLPMLPPAHPYFTAGAGYLIAGRLVQDLYIASLHTKFFPVEDVFTTGHCARRIGAHPPLHDGRFSCGQMVTDACQMTDMFTGHRVKPEMQFDIMEALHQESCRQKKKKK
jgi:beta-1,3-galactosyltransferase 1